jgi:hypothetical protein
MAKLKLLILAVLLAVGTSLCLAQGGSRTSCRRFQDRYEGREDQVCASRSLHHCSSARRWRRQGLGQHINQGVPQRR